MYMYLLLARLQDSHVYKLITLDLSSNCMKHFLTILRGPKLQNCVFIMCFPHQSYQFAVATVL